MSFGAAAAARGGRVPAREARCPCGGVVFSDCCAPYLAGENPETAEQLMRSRYTAFVLRDASHLRRTWHPRTRPRRLDLDEAIAWTGLTIVEARGGAHDMQGIVEFRARWLAGAEAGELHERSRFERARGRWLYVDGDVAEH